MIKKKKMDEGVTTLLKLLRLLAEDASIQDIEQAFRESPPLTYKLMMLVNSVAFGNRQKIQGVRHSIAMAGRLQIKRWLQLTLFAADGNDVFNQPLLDMAATRAGIIEQLALVHPQLQFDKESADRAFMTGILSLMKNIYDIPIAKIIENLNLNDEVAAALLDRTGHYGRLLRITELIEDLDMKSALEELASIGINTSKFPELQLHAFDWRKSG
jgi:EAL and modified HD-GYP domain-containing signal transduction protein